MPHSFPTRRSADLVAMKDRPKTPFVAPSGIRMVRIERRTGRKVFGVWPSDDPKSPVLWEPFKPESEPRRVIRRDELAREMQTAQAAPVRSDLAFLQTRGGISSDPAVTPGLTSDRSPPHVSDPARMPTT